MECYRPAKSISLLFVLCIRCLVMVCWLTHSQYGVSLAHRHSIRADPPLLLQLQVLATKVMVRRRSLCLQGMMSLLGMLPPAAVTSLWHSILQTLEQHSPRPSPLLLSLNPVAPLPNIGLHFTLYISTLGFSLFLSLSLNPFSWSCTLFSLIPPLQLHPLFLSSFGVFFFPSLAPDSSVSKGG